LVDHKKLYRVFQLISRLRSPYGASKSDLARDFFVSERTIERYFVLLKDLGFEIKKRSEFFCIEKMDKYSVNPEDLIVFSIEEAAIIRDAIVNRSMQTPLQKSIITKLYALTDMDELSETLYRQSISRNLSIIRSAIKSREQVLLKAYHSVNSNHTGDRLVEPIRFVSYFTYLLALEVKSKQVKQFKTDRIGTAETTGKPWEHESLHDNTHIDAFGMSGTTPIPVTLRLSPRAQRLMEEEHSDAMLNITPMNDYYIYQGQVYSFEGIGRFIMGLLNEVEIDEPAALREYVESKVKGWIKDK
jgi:predicted DNA-binding transcriptional regulator YafY